MGAREATLRWLEQIKTWVNDEQLAELLAFIDAERLEERVKLVKAAQARFGPRRCANCGELMGEAVSYWRCPGRICEWDCCGPGIAEELGDFLPEESKGG